MVGIIVLLKTRLKKTYSLTEEYVRHLLSKRSVAIAHNSVDFMMKQQGEQVHPRQKVGRLRSTRYEEDHGRIGWST